MTPIDIQLSRFKIKVNGRACSHMLGKGGGTGVLQTSLVIYCFSIFRYYSLHSMQDTQVT